MIKIGISGAESPLAGELLRLLLHHSEVDLKYLYAPSLTGRSVANYHKGIVGDTNLHFVDTIDLEAIDLLFIFQNEIPTSTRQDFPENLRLIYVPDTPKRTLPKALEDVNFVPGLSEMFRKPLVRGAVAARILPSGVALSLIALYPLALHLLLNDKIKITLSLPSFLLNQASEAEMKEELETLLKAVQLSFDSIENIDIVASNSLRAITAEIEFPCNVTEKEIDRIYEGVYDDHNFTFVVRNEPSPSEVEATQKCLLYFNKPTENSLKIKAVADGVLRGGAGDAVHTMNLLFGLFEKTGLNLKASLAFNDSSKN